MRRELLMARMDWLAANGYRVLALDEAVNA